MIKRYEAIPSHAEYTGEPDVSRVEDVNGEYVLYEDHLKDRQELIEVLRNYYYSNCGLKKLCGHEFECVCPSDAVKAILSANIED